MTKFYLSIFLSGFILFCFSQIKQNNNTVLQLNQFKQAEKIFKEAESLSLKAGDDEKMLTNADELYASALVSFQRVKTALEKTGNDSLSFFTKCRIGLISYYLNDLESARKEYKAAIALKVNLPSVPDSFSFIPLLYTGSIYYTQNQIDSALLYYKKAETVNNNYEIPLEGSERLYNRLGVIHYENGNYRQARNYFEKAITLTDPSKTGLITNYKLNIASLLIKSEDYSNAKNVYEDLLQTGVFPDEINHNLGIISLRLKDYKKAISYFKKTNYADNRKSIDLYYNFGEAWSGLNENDSAEFNIQKAIAENTKWNGHKKNITLGLILNFQARELAKQLRYKQALELYQQAIIQFDVSFNETDVNKNPEKFSAVFSYINLFSTLIAKANVQELIYQEQKDISSLEYSLDTYRSAFQLADHVEKTYDSDEARLFIGKIKYSAHSKPIDVCLKLYDLKEEKSFLEQAYFFDQQNKASVLSLSVQENELKSNNPAIKDLLEKETSLKSAITRLSLKSAQLIDSLQLQPLISEIREHEIQLGKLQEKINSDPDFRTGYYTSRIPGIKDLQKKLDNSSALLSWHLSENEIVVFIITAHQFSYYKSPLSLDFFNSIDSLKFALHNTSSENRYGGKIFSNVLYKILIAPLEAKLSNINRVIIIPDDELNYLPFEALADGNGTYLIEKFSIQYLYSTALLGLSENARKTKEILAFAPFASQGYSDTKGNKFSKLPASKDEVSGLQGKIFIDSSASKSNFLLLSNRYGIIHLATHANADNEKPLQSFIAFYQQPDSNAQDNKLFTQEIYNLNLDSTELVILSACETGTGKLVKGEGLMSLSRAFAYAGCPNIITSLWKAEDKTTAYIAKKLHYFLKKGYSKDKALQLAKLDFLKSDEIDPRLKSPNYWAHLIFIGNYEAKHLSFGWWWIALSIIIIALLFLATKRKRLSSRKLD